MGKGTAPEWFALLMPCLVTSGCSGDLTLSWSSATGLLKVEGVCLRAH